MKLDKISLDDLVDTPAPASQSKQKSKKVILSPRELAEQGKKFTPEDEKRWKQAVFEVQHRERWKGNWINWFDACTIYRNER
jgi:aspartyl/asparaginyl beta-hydroxylase (cupin superfamily)